MLIFQKVFLYNSSSFFNFDIPLCLYILQDRCQSPSTQLCIPLFQIITQSHVSLTQWPFAAIQIVTIQVQFEFHFCMCGFSRKHLVRSKIEIDGSILEQEKQFNYLGCELSLDGEPDFDKKK